MTDESDLPYHCAMCGAEYYGETAAQDCCSDVVNYGGDE